jgi:hypothetical protein
VVTNRYVWTGNSTVVGRNGIKVDGVLPNTTDPIVFHCDMNGNDIYDEVNDGQYLACGFFTRNDEAAYLDWSALRPMSELEYEKACRGPVFPVANEFAWGNTFIMSINSVLNIGAPDEISNTSGANCNAGGIAGGGRAGIFATAISDRVASGASYYGIMEMTGSIMVRCIWIGKQFTRIFTSQNGDGHLLANGDSDMDTWPLFMCGFRGTSPGFPVSNRSSIMFTGGELVPTSGIIGVRSF